MNSVIAVNTLLQFKSSTESMVKRVLWIGENNDAAYLIDIEDEKAFPALHFISELNEKLLLKRISVVTKDPWARASDERTISDAKRKRRDEAWEVIRTLVSSENEPGIYDPAVRGPLVEEASQKHKATLTTVYRYLRKYWQRGKVKNALLPDYENSGAPGKTRLPGKKKRGRPRKHAVDEDIGIGINVDEEVQRTFRIGIAKFYNTPQEVSLADAFHATLKEYFEVDHYYENGIKKTLLVPPSQRPTYIQFKYWYEKEKNLEKTISARQGKRTYALKHRPLLSNSTIEVYGPGSIFQFDATVADVYLVSRYNRNWIIGRPVIYVVIDVFSRMIVGFYVGLEGPSWLGAMMALTNTVSDKVAFCREYGITIAEEEWPCIFLPDSILGDRGEIESQKADRLINNLRVDIRNAAPYRADWKGIVERYFRTIKEQVKPFLPGFVIPDLRRKFGKDYRLQAKLDIYQFTQIIIHCIRQHNNQHYLEHYNRDKTLIDEDVQLKPIELWNWGIQNRSGLLRRFSEDIVKLNLLPQGKATIAKNGILFKSMRYSCDRALRENWFGRARTEGSEKIEVVYETRSANYIYLPSANGREFEKCHLLDVEERHMNKDLYEIDYLQEYEKYQARKNIGSETQTKVNLDNNIEDIVAEATAMTDLVQDKSASKASRIANIRNHRAAEKEMLREEQSFELSKNTSPSEPAAIVPLRSNEPESNSLKPPTYLTLLQNKRKQLKDE